MKHITLIILLTIVILSGVEVCYSQNWQWASQIGSNDQDGGTDIISDNSGNIYVTGAYQGTSCYFNTDTLANNGYDNFFLAKYDNIGNEVWIKRFGGNNSSQNYEYISGICYDSINNFIYITGAFSGTTSFGTITLSGVLQGFFLAKFDLDGNCIWAKQSTGGGQSVGLGVVLDYLGNIYVCGENSVSINLSSFSLPRGGFIAKYDTDGNCLWANKKFRYVSNYVSSELKSSGIRIYNSNILVAGSVLNDTVIVDTITALHIGINAAFISSFELNGNIQWLKLAGGGSESVAGYDFSIDNMGNSYLGGTFTETGYFDTVVLTNPLLDDAFLAKYNISGKLQWVKQLQATGGAGGYNISTNANGNTYFTGYFKGNASFGAYNVTASIAQDVFAARYDSSGVCLGVRNFGYAQGLAIYAKNNNSFWVEGQFWGSVSIGLNNFTSHGSTDIFIAKSDPISGIENKRLTTNGNQLVIYANPNKGICNITVPDELLNENKLTLKIYNNSGNLIQQIPVEIYQEKIIINLEAEAKGIYNVILTNGKINYSGKIILE